VTESYRVLIADAIAAEGIEPLVADGRFELIEKSGLQGEDLARAIECCDAVIVRSTTRITRASLAYADKLKVIGRAGVGVDNIDVEAATEKGVAVLNAPSGNTISAAELTCALLLALARRVPAADRSMKAGEWDRKSFNGIEVYGKTLGLVGAGRIGGEVARRARAFGMRVMAHDPFLTQERAKNLEIELASLEEVLRRSDIISLHVPLTDATAGLIGDAQLAMMKPGAFLVNAARGGVVDEAALARALEAGRLGGVALDVFAEEPLPRDHPLRNVKGNVVLTPHVGAATLEAQQNVAVEIAQAVRDALIDGDYTRAVNAPAIGGEEMRRLRPLMQLAERLGALAVAMADGAIESLEVRYAGAADDALNSLSAAAMVGVLSTVLGRHAINFVNAMHLAAARGIEVQRVRLGPHGDYAEYIELRVTDAKSESRLAGALLGQGHPRLVRIRDYHVDIVPKGTIVVLENRDVPGVIGRVGTLLGDAGINIGEYHQARLEAGGAALAAISVDGRLSSDVLEKLRSLPEVVDVRQAQLD
jgi:D-3-phosphoglycerate dehydrogenase